MTRLAWCGLLDSLTGGRITISQYFGPTFGLVMATTVPLAVPGLVRYCQFVMCTVHVYAVNATDRDMETLNSTSPCLRAMPLPLPDLNTSFYNYINTYIERAGDAEGCGVQPERAERVEISDPACKDRCFFYNRHVTY